jgi:riboflavin kinase/FMN adenylyltransferase
MDEARALPEVPSTVTALGFFDGVHLGHRALLERAVADANRLGCASAVLTFDDDDPLYKPSAPRLTDTQTRLSLIADCGIQYAFVFSFERIRALSPADFVRDVLVGQCHTRLAECGFNFRFGKNAAGDADTLRRLMSAAGGEARTVEAQRTAAGELISSSAVRAALERGDMQTVTEMLGREYSLTLPVLHGKELGRTIGLPTINQSFPPHFAIPAYGVYAATCEIDGVSLPAVTNVGVRPTVGGSSVNCESHILNYSGWLYGKTVRLTLHRHVRPEIKFDSLTALKAQIEKDICEVKKEYGIH